jgi:hypothetical protein
MNKNKRLFIVEVLYVSGIEKYFVHETRADARDHKRTFDNRPAVLRARVLPAARGPSNVGAR